MKISRLIVAVAINDDLAPDDVAQRMTDRLSMLGTQDGIHWGTIEVRANAKGWKQTPEHKARRIEGYLKAIGKDTP